MIQLKNKTTLILVLKAKNLKLLQKDKKRQR